MSQSPVLSDAPADPSPKESTADGSAPRSRLRRYWPGVGVAFGLGILVALFAMAYVAPLIRPFSANEVAGAPFSPPDGTHWLGTDDLGRDYFVRLCVAGRTSLSIALAGSLLALVAGSAVGFAAGVGGRWLDTLLMGGVDLLLSFPSLLLGLAAVTVFSPSMTTLIAVLSLVSLPHFARIVRARCLEVRELEFVLSARISGVRSSVIVLKHLLPNVLPLMMVQLANSAAIVILLESALSYLGLGVQPPTPSWGRMVAEAQNYLTDSPWLVLGAGGALLLSSVGWGLIGEGFAVSRRSVV
ncbi:ABC transporter permease [Streptomyces sp. NBC_01450]|uniref:ABC transporter permease n=1 Tax=Streptomyces sp. NBC_01450 TaxID=2903871 RepID=UPI002E3170C1|nr:ABC transporter permease [Streptomyces sp. NBC_01450]